jgi:hypothetical protein
LLGGGNCSAQGRVPVDTVSTSAAVSAERHGPQAVRARAEARSAGREEAASPAQPGPQPQPLPAKQVSWHLTLKLMLEQGFTSLMSGTVGSRRPRYPSVPSWTLHCLA